MRQFLCMAVLAAAPLVLRADDPKPAPKAEPSKSEQSKSEPMKLDPAAKAVIEKAIAAHGGKEALDKFPVSTAKIKGEMKVFEADSPFTGELTALRPDKVRLELNAEVLGMKTAIVHIVNGDKVKQTRNGAVIAPGDAVKAEMRQVMFMQETASLTPLLSGKYGLKAEKDEKVGDADAAVVLVTAKGMKDVRYFFDKKTGFLVKSSRKGLLANSIEPKEAVEDIVMSEFKKFGGVQLATKSVVTQDGKKFMSLEILEAKFIEKADPKLFSVDD